jgi:ketopantoate reductase
LTRSCVKGGIRKSPQVADRLLPNDAYDLALIAVRRDQLSSITPDLAANKTTPTLLFMLNNPLGSAQLIDTFGPDRVSRRLPADTSAQRRREPRIASIVLGNRRLRRSAPHP